MRSLASIIPGAVKDALTELQGQNITVVAGAVAGTKMNIAGLRTEDQLLSVMVSTDAAGALANDVANCTIQDTRASGTITISGNPVADETVTVNGDVFTWKATPTDPKHVKITAGDNTAMALALSNAINAWQTRRVSYTVPGGTPGEAPRTAELVATPAAGVVTITSVKDGPGNAVTITNSANMTVANSGSASVTITCASAVNGNTLTLTKLDGTTVVFTVRTTATVGVLTDIQLAGTDILQAVAVKNAINAYEQANGTLGYVASTVGTAVVTVVPKDPLYGNMATLSEASSNVAASGANLAGGTATGGIKSTTNLTGKSLVVTWFNKQ